MPCDTISLMGAVLDQHVAPAVKAPGFARQTGETVYLVDDNEPIILVNDIQGYVLHTPTAAIACQQKRVHH